MNAIILLTILSLAMPIFGEETQEKRQDKRGILGLSHGGFGGFGGLQGDSLGIGAGYGQSYLGDASLGGFSVPSYSNSYSAPLYSSQRLDYSGGLGYGGLGYGGRSSGGLGYAGIRHGYSTAGFGYGAGSQGLNTGYRYGW